MNFNFHNIFSGPEAPLAEFVLKFFEENGALIEKGHAGATILMPRELAQALDVEEYIGVTTEPKLDPNPQTPVYPVHFGSHLLDSVLSMAGSRPALTECNLKFHYLKKSGFDSLIQDRFTFFKSTGSIASVAEFKTRYVLMAARYLAQSDEQKEGMITIALNEETRAYINDLDQMLAGQDKTFSGTHSLVFTPKEVDRLMEFARPHISKKVTEQTADFQKSMSRRFERDTKSLEEYYSALMDEMRQSLQRSGLSEQGRKDREEKIAQIPEELAIKKKELLTKYSIKMRVSLSAVLVVTTPAIRIHFHAKTGHLKKTLPLIYNPITKSMDPLVCESCKKSIHHISFCKNMHLICNRCSDGKCACCN